MGGRARIHGVRHFKLQGLIEKGRQPGHIPHMGRADEHLQFAVPEKQKIPRTHARRVLLPVLHIVKAFRPLPAPQERHIRRLHTPNVDKDA